MSNEHKNDDEIRESIPSVSRVYWDGVYCLPVGYGLRNGGGVYLHGRKLEGVLHEAGAWDHAVAREKARRRREGQVIAADKAAAMLDAVTKERDALREKLERVRGVQRWSMRYHVRAEMVPVGGNGSYVRYSDLAAIIGEDGEA